MFYVKFFFKTVVSSTSNDHPKNKILESMRYAG